MAPCRTLLAVEPIDEDARHTHDLVHALERRLEAFDDRRAVEPALFLGDVAQTLSEDQLPGAGFALQPRCNIHTLPEVVEVAVRVHRVAGSPHIHRPSA